MKQVVNESTHQKGHVGDDQHFVPRELWGGARGVTLVLVPRAACVVRDRVGARVLHHVSLVFHFPEATIVTRI